MNKTIDWIRFCRDYHVRTGSKLRNKEWLAVACPACRDTETHGGINIRTNTYHCWHGCDIGIYDFVSAVVGCANDSYNVHKALENYTDNLSQFCPIKKEEERDISVDVVRGIKLPGHSTLGVGCQNYLRHRGFNPEYMEKKYGLRDGGIGGVWAYRLIIPVYEDGKVVCWQGRHIGQNKIRYRSSSLKESINIKDTIYNLDNCKGDTVIVCEGVFDCWKIGDGCCCLFGISVKDKQLALLAERYKTIYILFDPEPEAQQRAMECVRKLQNLGVHVENIYMESDISEDPGDLTKEEIIQVRKELLSDDSIDTPWLLGG